MMQVRWWESAKRVITVPVWLPQMMPNHLVKMRRVSRKRHHHQQQQQRWQRTQYNQSSWPLAVQQLLHRVLQQLRLRRVQVAM